MESPLFRVMTFAVRDSGKCACVITGYRGKVTSYKKVIRILNDNGYTVIAYEHSHAVLTQGNPELLPLLVDQICADFTKRSADYQEVICTGASIGAGLCFAMQRKLPKVKFGIYAGAGVSPPETIYDAPLFYFVRKRFNRHAIDKSELRKAWQEVDILPTKGFAQTPFIMALGKKDWIVNYDKSVTTLHAWQIQGQTIKIITKTRLGHRGVIRWYKRHFNELLTTADNLNS